MGPTAVHGIRELHEDRVLLHDTLDMLTTDTDNALVVLIGYMERNRSRHLLFHKRQSLLHGVVIGSNDVDVEIILPKALEHDLDVAWNDVSLWLVRHL